jgi:hypothetical protein
LGVFSEKWAFNRAGKTVSKIGIYALPPLKSEFYRIFIISRPNFVPDTIFKMIFYAMGLIIRDSILGMILLLFHFLVLVLLVLIEKPNSFSGFGDALCFGSGYD